MSEYMNTFVYPDNGGCAMPWLRWLLASHYGGLGSIPDQSMWDVFLKK